MPAGRSKGDPSAWERKCAGVWFVGSKRHLDRRAVILDVGCLASSVLLFFPLFSLQALSCPERLLGRFLHELRFEGSFFLEPTPSLFQDCCLLCLDEWKDFQSNLILLCWKKTCLSHPGCTKAADSQGNTSASRQHWIAVKKLMPLCPHPYGRRIIICLCVQ